MASSPFLSSPSPPTAIATSSSLQTSFFPKTTQLSITKKLKKPSQSAPNKSVSCKATRNGSQQNPTPPKNNGDSALNKFDRRDVLIGLGGLYGATNVAGGEPFALAAPIAAPDFTKCGDALVTKPNSDISKKEYCCPPTSEKIIDFRPPPVSKLRYRPPAHSVTPQYLAKFKQAMDGMKSLDDDDPRSFKSQANVHCAYCNGAYDQVGFPDLDLQVHNSWLFFPFHRLYFYFYERILGKMINDPDFTMPFWNWDSPAGMPIPAIYADSTSPLYDSKRNVNHQPPKLADLDYGGTERNLSDQEQISSNLKSMYREMIRNSKTASMFFGQPYRAGDDPDPGAGSIEKIPHIPIHIWVGDPREKFSEDMGNLYSSGRDPLFYAHHSNVDRLWSIWKQLPGPKRTDITDTDWLDASFLFYDENKNLVRCKVRDCLDTRVLGYDYQPVDIPWLKTKPIPHKFAGKPPGRPGRPGPQGRRPGPPGGGPRGHAHAAEIRSEAVRNAFPLVLDKLVRIEVPRPKKSRSKSEKEDEEEVLVIGKIQLNRDAAVKFDVYINDEDDETPTGPEDSEFAGSFVNLPHNHNHGKQLITNLTLGLTDLLEDLDVEGDDSIIVTLVPKEGKGLVSIGNIKIDYIKE